MIPILAFSLAHATPLPDRAEGSSRHFHHTVETSASPEAIWARWTDCDSWHTWDAGLEAASLTEALGPDGQMQLGSRGTLVSGGRETPFEITEFDPDRWVVAFESRLPLGGLVVTRTLEPLDDGGTRFTHDVRFRGVGGFLLAPMLGPDFRRMLPRVMMDLATLAAPDPGGT